MIITTRATCFYLNFVCFFWVFSLHCEFGRHYQCSGLLVKICIINDWLCVGCDVKLCDWYSWTWIGFRLDVWKWHFIDCLLCSIRLIYIIVITWQMSRCSHMYHGHRWPSSAFLRTCHYSCHALCQRCVCDSKRIICYGARLSWVRSHCIWRANMLLLFFWGPPAQSRRHEN